MRHRFRFSPPGSGGRILDDSRRYGEVGFTDEGQATFTVPGLQRITAWCAAPGTRPRRVEDAPWRCRPGTV